MITPLDEGRVVESLIRKDKLTLKAAAHILGRKTDWAACRLALATKLSPRAADRVATRDLGPTHARLLTALSHTDQDVLLETISRHGLNGQETTILIQTFRIADSTDRRNLLKDPLATVRPTPSPIKSPRLAEIERTLEGIGRALSDLHHLRIPPDLSAAERRRIEALHRQVCQEAIEVAHQLERQGPSLVSSTPRPEAGSHMDVGGLMPEMTTERALPVAPLPLNLQADGPSP